MKLKTNVKAGSNLTITKHLDKTSPLLLNHNQSGLPVKTRVKAGPIGMTNL